MGFLATCRRAGLSVYLTHFFTRVALVFGYSRLLILRFIPIRLLFISRLLFLMNFWIEFRIGSSYIRLLQYVTDSSPLIRIFTLYSMLFIPLSVGVYPPIKRS